MNDLFRTKGRVTVAVSCEYLRDLTDDDVKTFSEIERGVKPVPVSKLRERHHAAARYFADGRSILEISILTGYSINRLYVLKLDPAFVELIEYYKGQNIEEWAESDKLMAHLNKAVTADLLDMIEEKPDEISVGAKIEMMKATADRTGFGPHSKQTQVNVNVNMAERMERAASRVKQIEGAALPRDVSDPPTSEGDSND